MSVLDRTRRRRGRPAAVAAAAALFGLGALLGPGALPAQAVSGGPVIDRDFPDPDVIRVGSTYYAYATNVAGTHIQYATSGDLTSWSAGGGDALPTLGAWADPNWSFGDHGDHGVWAPDVVDTGDGFTMYYVAHDRASDRQCIGAARSSSPSGPFAPRDTPIVCTPGLGGSIDPSSFSENGQRYLLWKNDGNCCSQDTWLRIQPVSGDGTAVTGGETLLVKQDRPDEGNLVEAPVLWKHGGTYVLFFSANGFTGNGYETSYARASSLLGPYIKAAAPLLTTDAFAGTVRGPGGEDVVTGPDGKDRIVFHGWDPSYGYRAMYVADLGWANDYPVVKGAKVHYEAEAANLTDAVARDAAGGASGGRAVGHVDFDDSRVAFTVYAPRDGTYRLSTRFGNGSGASASHRLWVDGADAGTVDYPATAWDAWQTVDRDVTLTEGWNTITYGKGANYAEIDAIDVA